MSKKRNKKAVINVRDYTEVFVGQDTIKNIEQELINYEKQGIKGVEVNVDELPLRDDFNLDLARLELRYLCKFTGLADQKEGIIANIKDTGYLIKESIGGEAFSKKMKQLIMDADYPMMLIDNKGQGDELIPINVIQPFMFDNVNLHYYLLKPNLLEPRYLQKACWVDNETIWEQKKVFIADIGSKEFGIRFAKNEKERTILDIFSGIIDGTITEFDNLADE